ncbi:hypothetical protein AB7M22_003167 [Pseudomonas sp. ADAK2 TE3594]
MANHHEFEAEIKNKQISATIFNAIAKTYCDYMINSGASKAIGYASIAASGALLMTIAAPVGIVGISVTAIGLTLSGYGLAGASAYSSDAAFYLTGKFNGGQLQTTYGRNFDSIYGTKPSDRRPDPNQTKTQATADYIIDKSVGVFIDAATKAGKPSISIGLDELNKLFESILTETDKVLEEIYKQQKAEASKSKASPQLKSAPQLKPGRTGQNNNGYDDGIIDSHGHLNTGEGTKWTGNDAGPKAPNVSNIA